jgi:hypothetical protein
MLQISLRFLLLSVVFLFHFQSFAQEPPEQPVEEQPQVFVVVKNDGVRFYGTIISQDAREVLIETQELGLVYIPRHEIREIRQVASRELDEKGLYLPGEVFSTRYFISTNGLPVQKGENYVLVNMYGPDFQFGISENLGVGLMTTWMGAPIVATVKYSINLKEDLNLGMGMLLGTGSWALPRFGFALPFGAITYGDRAKNITFSTGYGGIFYQRNNYNYYTNTYNDERAREGSFLFSLGGMVKAGRVVSFVFDSFLMTAGKERTYTERHQNYNWETETWYWIEETYTSKRGAILLIAPGLRFQTRAESAFQIGFAGLIVQGETSAMPFPMLQWYRKL